MKLLPGCAAEYEKRHQEIWPGLVALLKQYGIREYSIFLDPATGNLFAFLYADAPASLSSLPAQEIMQQWWTYMKDLMETNEDDSPVSFPLKEVFYLP